MVLENLVLDSVIAILTYLIFITGLNQRYKVLLIILQSALLLFRFVNAYVKNIPRQALSFKQFLLEPHLHYYNTNPKGQQLARSTGIDERIAKLLNGHREPKDVG